MSTRCSLTLCLVVALLLVSCGTPPTAAPQPTATVAIDIPASPLPTETSPPPTPADTLPPPTDTPPPPTDTPLPPTATQDPGLSPLPPEPQRIEFTNEDGQVLVGTYYPAATNPAPVVVLMHWMGGDRSDWLYVGMAAWLQNRGLETPAAPVDLPFDNPYPFSPLPEDLSFGVFIFDFSGFGESVGSGSDFEKDALAAYQAAAGLPGVDPGRVAGIGASIGANWAAGACQENCLGALSLGPQDINFSYAGAVAAMDAQGKPAWCVASEDATYDLEACNNAQGALYQKFIYPQGGHAMLLFRAELGLQPPIDQVILEFLEGVFGL